MQERDSWLDHKDDLGNLQLLQGKVKTSEIFSCPFQVVVSAQQAHQLEVKYPSAASSLLEGLDEMFTVNAMGLPKVLRRCLCTTNIIESPCNASVGIGHFLKLI